MTSAPQTDLEHRHGDWMQTYTGRAFWPLDPRSEEVDIKDIAHALAHQCRYAGHCNAFYSVAQHSVLVAQAVPEEIRLEALLHDASEAYLVDVPRPVKRFLPGYREAEERVERAIAARFGLAYPWDVRIKEADDRILHDERAALMGESPHEWNLRGEPLGIAIGPWSPNMARQEFLSLASDLLFHRARLNVGRIGRKAMTESEAEVRRRTRQEDLNEAKRISRDPSLSEEERCGALEVAIAIGTLMEKEPGHGPASD